MPIKHAAEKAMRQVARHARRNRAVKERVKKLVRDARKVFEAKDTAKAKAAVAQALKALDRAVKGGIIKKNTAARRKSGLAKRLNALAKTKS